VSSNSEIASVSDGRAHVALFLLHPAHSAPFSQNGEERIAFVEVFADAAPKWRLADGDVTFRPNPKQRRDYAAARGRARLLLYRDCEVTVICVKMNGYFVLGLFALRSGTLFAMLP